MSDILDDDGGSGKEVWFINRDVVVLRHKEPFAAWARKVLEHEGEDRYEPWSDAFLIPSTETEEERLEWLEENHDLLWDLELEAWFTDRAMWPTDRSWESFQEWFEIEMIEIAWDLVDSRLSSEPPEPWDEDRDGIGEQERAEGPNGSAA